MSNACSITLRCLSNKSLLTFAATLYSIPLFLLHIIQDMPFTILFHDHFHLFDSVLETQFGKLLYSRVKNDFKKAIESHHRREFETYRDAVYKTLEQWPSHKTYAEKFLSEPCRIARYEVRLIRGSLGLVSSSPAEANHSSIEAHLPTKGQGVMSAEEHFNKLLNRQKFLMQKAGRHDSDWLVLQQTLLKDVVEGTPEWHAISLLSSYAYNTFFVQEYKRRSEWCCERVHDHNDGSLVGHKIWFHKSHILSSFTLNVGERCS